VNRAREPAQRGVPPGAADADAASPVTTSQFDATWRGRKVALKVLDFSAGGGATGGVQESLRRAAREAQVWATLSVRCRNVCRMLGYARGGSKFGFVVERYGGSLEGAIGAGGMPAGEALPVLRALLEALADCHAQDPPVAHFDVKPANVLVDGDRVALTDFGVAGVVDALATFAGTFAGAGPGVFGTCRYAPPEQLDPDKRALRGHKSDMWAVAATAVHMLTGAAPFPGMTIVEILTAVLVRGRVPELPRGVLPAGVEDALRRCFEQDPDGRPSAVELLATVEAAAGGDARGAGAGSGREVPAESDGGGQAGGVLAGGVLPAVAGGSRGAGELPSRGEAAGGGSGDGGGAAGRDEAAVVVVDDDSDREDPAARGRGGGRGPAGERSRTRYSREDLVALVEAVERVEREGLTEGGRWASVIRAGGDWFAGRTKGAVKAKWDWLVKAAREWQVGSPGAAPPPAERLDGAPRRSASPAVLNAGSGRPPCAAERSSSGGGEAEAGAAARGPAGARGGARPAEARRCARGGRPAAGDVATRHRRRRDVGG